MAEVELIRAETPEELIDKLNERDDFFATQVHHDKTGWLAFCWIKEDSKKVNQPKQSPVEMATEKQVAYLSSLGYEGNMKLTKQEASKLIEEYKNQEY